MCRGRVRLQVMGFLWVFVIFLVCAIFYHDLIKKQYIAVFQVRLAWVLGLGFRAPKTLINLRLLPPQSGC